MIGHALFSKSAKKYYRKAGRCHKKAEAFYNARDFELAEAYYDKAEEHRRKARMIES